MAIKFDLQLTVKKADGSVLTVANSNGAKDTYAEAKEVVRGKLQTNADAAAASAADFADAASQLS